MITRQFGPAEAGKYGYVGGVRGGFLVFKREVVDQSSPRFGQSEVVGWFASEAEASSAIADLDPVTAADMASTWVPFVANVEGYEFSFDNEVQTLDDEWYGYVADEVFDGVTAEQLAARENPAGHTPAPYGERLPYSPGAMPALLEAAFSRSGWVRPADRDLERERGLVAAAQAGDSLAFGLLVESYSAAFISALSSAKKKYRGLGVRTDDLKSALLGVFFMQVRQFDVDAAPASESLLGGRSTRNLMFAFARAARQAAADSTLPVSLDGRELSGDRSVPRSQGDDAGPSALVFSWQRRASIVEMTTDDDDSFSGVVPAEWLEQQRQDRLATIIEAASRAEVFLARLSDEQRALVSALFGLAGEPAVSQWAYAKQIGVDQATVSRRLNAALAVMRGEGGE